VRKLKITLPTPFSLLLHFFGKKGKILKREVLEAVPLECRLKKNLEKQQGIV
jgi:hypothetical protein